MNTFRTGLTVIALMVLGAVSAFAQVHRLTTDVLAPGKVDLSLQATNGAVDNSLQAIARFGVVKNIEALVGQGFAPGETYFGVKANLLANSRYKLVTGIYKYSTRREVVAPYLLGGVRLFGMDVYGGGIFYNSRFEPNIGATRDVTKSLKVGVEYQGETDVNQFLRTYATARITRTTDFTGGLVISNLAHARVYPEVGVTFHLR